jgi:hydroxymethylpyrimidine/phosphomethylpyrimidine kinase
MIGRVLVVAGSDSGGGAGIQADIKTITALGGYAATAITALTAQDTTGVHGIVGVEPAFIRQQIRVVVRDIGADAVKTGMLHSAAVIEAVFAELDAVLPGVPVVVDPVLVAKGGAALLESEALATLKRIAVPRAAVLTPNLPEAEALTGLSDAERAAAALLAMGARAVLLKGGHAPGEIVRDLLVGRTRKVFEAKRIDTPHTHGTGCTLASAIAVGLAQGLALEDAVARAHAYVQEAIRTAPGFGRGHGPLNHAHTLRKFPSPLEGEGQGGG